MKKFLFRLMAMLLILCCLTQCALAENAYIMERTDVYTTASTQNGKAGTLSVGTQVELLAQNGTWAKIGLNGRVGYVKLENLACVTYLKDTVMYTSQSCGVYQLYTTDSRKLATLKAGTRLNVYAVAGEWAYVGSGSNRGYVQAEHLTSQAPSAPESTPSTSATTAYVCRESANVYASYSESSRVVISLNMNYAVTVTDVRGNWCRVVNNGKYFYMKKSDLSLTPVSVTPEEPDDEETITQCDMTAYVSAQSACVYRTADTSSRVLATLSNGAAVNVTAYTDDWCRVTNNGVHAFMLRSCLTLTAPEAPAVPETPAPQPEDNQSSYQLAYGDTGEKVMALQTRLKELKFFSGSIGGNYLELTQAAVTAFQAAADLPTTGIADAATLTLLFSDDAPEAEIGGSTATPATGRAIEMDWWTSGIQQIFARGTIATITDVETGICWQEKRSGGTNHADVQPVTAADTAAMLAACGSWSWDRRAIIVTINGANYAASMNCMPHGSGSITGNNFDGHHCIHFTNSRTHGSNSVCSLHQAAIKKAAKAYN